MYSTAIRKVLRIILVIVYVTVFFFLTHPVSVSLKCMYDLADGFIFKSTLLKGSAWAKIWQNFKKIQTKLVYIC